MPIYRIHTTIPEHRTFSEIVKSFPAIGRTTAEIDAQLREERDAWI